jgi:hypothetical protein
LADRRISRTRQPAGTKERFGWVLKTSPTAGLNDAPSVLIARSIPCPLRIPEQVGQAFRFDVGR